MACIAPEVLLVREYVLSLPSEIASASEIWSLHSKPFNIALYRMDVYHADKVLRYRVGTNVALYKIGGDFLVDGVRKRGKIGIAIMCGVVTELRLSTFPQILTYVQKKEGTDSKVTDKMTTEQKVLDSWYILRIIPVLNSTSRGLLQAPLNMLSTKLGKQTNP